MVSKKNKIELTAESMRELMQETYSEIVDERNKAVVAYRRFMRDVTDNSDIALIGKTTNELLKIIDSAIEKKLRLIKIQGDIIYRNKQGGEETEKIHKITDEDRRMIETMMTKSDTPKEINYG